MNDHYLTLFFATGSPIFYLLYRSAARQEEESKIAWQETRAELI